MKSMEGKEKLWVLLNRKGKRLTLKRMVGKFPEAYVDFHLVNS